MRLRRIVLSAIAGSALAGWLAWPAVEPPPVAVGFGGPCSSATRQWAEEWRQGRIGRRHGMYVLCQPGGRTYAAFVSWRSPDGERISSWRQVTTFIGDLPAPCRERIDIFDTAGQLLEYATLDREARRVEFYSASSRFTGHGRFDTSSGRVERFGLEGQRQGSLALPIPHTAEGSSVP